MSSGRTGVRVSRRVGEQTRQSVESPDPGGRFTQGKEHLLKAWLVMLGIWLSFYVMSIFSPRLKLPSAVKQE